MNRRDQATPFTLPGIINPVVAVFATQKMHAQVSTLDRPLPPETVSKGFESRDISQLRSRR
jgi:hypothetical protein